jgi:hypothetical protein
MREITTNEELSEIVKNSISWSDVIRACGAPIGGAAYQHYQSRVKKLNFNTSHFLGKAAHAGPRGTGKAKRKHWSEILIFRKTNDRERSNKFRRAYKEYCEEKNIPIQCVDCKNGGEWYGKKLKLEINHKDDCRWNNIPENLEWLCPNCHSIKTIY